MDTSTFIEAVRVLAFNIFSLVVPALLASLIVAVIIGVLQAVMQIQEQTLSFFPKLVVMFLVFYLMGPFMIDQLITISQDFIRMIPELLERG